MGIHRSFLLLSRSINTSRLAIYDTTAIKRGNQHKTQGGGILVVFFPYGVMEKWGLFELGLNFKVAIIKENEVYGETMIIWNWKNFAAYLIQDNEV